MPIECSENGAQAILAALRRVLEQRSEVRLALLFGSWARGQARSDSDVDVALDAPAEVLLDIASELSTALGRDVDVVSLRDAGVPLMRRLIAEGRIVHQGTHGAAAAWRSRTLLALEIDGPWYERMRDAWLKRVAQQGLLDGQP